MRALAGTGARVAALLALALAILGGRVLYSSRVELRDGEARLAAGSLDDEAFAQAVDRLGRAARLHLPGNPFSAHALGRLEAVAVDAEQQGHRERALRAWREVRSAIRATRSAVPGPAALAARADERIARLAAALESPSVDPGADEAARVRWHAERLAEDRAPSPGWSLLALCGLAGWLSSALGLFFRGLDERLRFRGTAPAWAAGIALGFALFVVALGRA